jgi:hypothetical protein
MTDNSRLFRPACAMLFALGVPVVNALAQTPTVRRLDLSDSARAAQRADSITVRRLSEPQRAQPAPPQPRVVERRTGTGLLRNSFVRDQAILGLAVYGPSFATTMTDDPVAWTAAYMVVGAGSYFAASELSRNMTISEPTAWLATQTALRGGLLGWGLTYGGDANRHHQAAGIFFGSVLGTAAGIGMGQGMTDGEVAATTFGADLGALTGLGISHMADPYASVRQRVGVVALAGLAGYPIGYLYANTAPYRVTAGDVTTLWASAAIGATVGGALMANGKPDARTVAGTLTAGALVGTLVGDQLLVRRFDHTPEEGQIVALSAIGGGLMGAGLGALSCAECERTRAATIALTAIGGIAGVIIAEQYLRTPVGQARVRRSALGRVEFNPGGVLAAASGVTGVHPILHWTF